MGRDLFGVMPGLRARAQGLDDAARAQLGRSLLAAYVDAPQTAELEEELEQTRNAQLTLGLVSTALCDALVELGIEPAFVAGHSYGELPALHAAGAYDFPELVRLSAERGRLLGAAASRVPGAMLAVGRAPEWVAERLAGLPGPLVVSNFNGPRQAVVSGTAEGSPPWPPAATPTGRRPPGWRHRAPSTRR